MTYLWSVIPWLLYLTLLITIVAGLFLNILGLPGLWLIVIAAIAYGWWFDFTYIGWWTIGILIVLGGLAELVEFLAGAAGSKQAGGSKRGMVAAIVGGVLGGILGTGLIPIPILGTIVGTVVGSAIAVYPVEKYAVGKTHKEAFEIGYGAAKGRLWGLLGKTVIGVVMAMVTAVIGIPYRWTSATPTTLPTSAPTTLPATLPAEPTTTANPG